MLKTLLECHENQDINMSTAPSPPKKQKKIKKKQQDVTKMNLEVHMLDFLSISNKFYTNICHYGIVLPYSAATCGAVV